MKKRFRRRFWTLAAVVCAAGAVWFAVSLVKTLAGYRKGDEDIQMRTPGARTAPARRDRS